MSFQSFLGKVTGQPSTYSKKSQYRFGRVLGAGTFGVVRVAKNMVTGEEFAAKIILKKKLKGQEGMILDEIKMLQQLNHPHIVAFHDWFESKDKFYIMTQMATGGELFDRIVNQGRFTESDAARCMQDVAEAIGYLHRRDIVHRDLKPENLLYVTEEPDSDLVLADFGIAKTLSSPEEKLTSMAGSFGYAAPEVLRGTGHGKPCDIWSLGVVTYTVLSGYSPFRAETVNEFMDEVSPGFEPVFHVKYWKHVSEDAKRFVRSLLQYDPEKRPTAEEVIRDPWLTGKSKHTTDDLLPNIRAGFNARQKLALAIEAVRLQNRIKNLQMLDEGSDEEDANQRDPNKLDPFRDVQKAFVHKRASSGSGARFQEVVMAAARHKEITGRGPGHEDQSKS